MSIQTLNARDSAIRYISEQLESQKWGSSYVDELASYISENCPSVKGFNRRGLYRMKQFYETYKDNEFVSTLLTQISWTNHLLILSSAKTEEEREFYIKLCFIKKFVTNINIISHFKIPLIHLSPIA